MTRNTVSRSYKGFTLVELLVVIGILGTISSLFIYAYRTARVESQNQKTRTTVEKLSDILNGEIDPLFTSSKYDCLRSFTMHLKPIKKENYGRSRFQDFKNLKPTK